MAPVRGVGNGRWGSTRPRRSLSPRVAGFGVNLQAVNHVVHYTRSWNPANEDQATDRAYRIGQKKDVYVYSPSVIASM
jgi:SNF2 family DNA or RNA helicase